MPEYRWDTNANRYRDERGRFLSRERALAFVDQSLAATGTVTDTLASLVANNRIAAGDWSERLWNEVKDEHIRQYLSAVGGREMMTAQMWGELGGVLSDQRRFYVGFAEEVAAGNLSEAQIRQRSQLYINASREAYERGHTRSQGIPPGALPAFPADGSSECGSNDKCSWRIEPTDGGWNAYWTLSDAEHCATCSSRGTDWNPYFVAADTRARARRHRVVAPDHGWDQPFACGCPACLESLAYA